jgi:pyruvate,orthophosphate dikinase
MNVVNFFGGKGKGLREMVSLGLPVPPGFIIPTTICNEYRQLQAEGALSQEWWQALMAEVTDGMTWLKDQFGYTPLVSVRSGAPVSMPGMMDTVLNVGLVPSNFHEWQDRIGATPACDSVRRLMEMLGSTAYGIDKKIWEFQQALAKKECEGEDMLEDEKLVVLLNRYKDAFEKAKQFPFPDSLEDQLSAAIMAVFDSWMSERAIEYRKINGIDDSMGTACVIQAMVFGNMGEDSGSGVAFTRDPSTGEKQVLVEYLSNAQGEDVVSGTHTPNKIDMIKEINSSPEGLWKADLWKAMAKLEEHYNDMVDIEFTVQQNKLFILQSRVGKRSAAAAVKIAVDMHGEDQITRAQALDRISVDQFKVLLRPMVDPKFDKKPWVKGLGACPGVAVGVPVFSSKNAINCKEPCILVTQETTPEDIGGMNKAVGIITMTGGATSHAAVVARAMDKPCIVGVGSDLDLLKAIKLTMDGSSGKVWRNQDVPVIDASKSKELDILRDWCLERMDWVPQEMLCDGERPQRIMAAEWWDDVDALETVLEDLTNLPSRNGIVLDLRCPVDFYHQQDGALLNAFGPTYVEAEDKFMDAVIGDLKDAAFNMKLHGLTIVAPWMEAAFRHLLIDNGIKVPKTGCTSMADIFEGAQPDEEFIIKVIGGKVTWEKMKMLLAQAGITPTVVQQSAPADYAVFAALSKNK